MFSLYVPFESMIMCTWFGMTNLRIINVKYSPNPTIPECVYLTR